MYKNVTTPGAIIGYRKNGTPIRLIAGGDPTHTTHTDPAQVVTPPVPAPQVSVPVTQGATFTQEQVWAAVEAARTEEKNKLYGRLEKNDEALRTLTAERDERIAAQKAADDAEAARIQAAEDEKLTLKQRFERSEEEHARRFAELQQERDADRALLVKEREFSALENYKVSKVAELREPRPENQHFGIMDEFVDLVDGSTQEEVDRSIATMVAKTRSIVEGVQQHEINARAATPGVSPTAGNLGPIEQSGGTKTYSAAEIAAMAPNSKEYLALRAAHGMGRSTSNRGLYG